MIRLKAIKSIEKLLCFLSSYINLQLSNFCSLKPFLYWHYDDWGVQFGSGLFDGMRLFIIGLTINLTLIDLINLWANSFHS